MRKGLMRQRFRWSFGTLQAVWKHRAAFVRNKAMGLFALPNILIFQMLLPLVSPFIDIMFVVRHRPLLHRPALPSRGGFGGQLPEAAGLLPRVPGDRFRHLVGGLQPGAAASGEQGRSLAAVPHLAAALRYRQLFSVVLFKTLKRAIDGKPFNWDKLERTAKMSKQTEALTEAR